MYFGMCMLGLAIVGRVVFVQFVQGEKWRAKAESSITNFHTIEAVRGNIYSDNGSLLATSVPIYEVRMDLACPGLTDEAFKEGIDTLCLELANLYEDKDARQWKREIMAARDAEKQYHLIRRRVKYTDLKKMRDFPIFRRGQYKGGFIYIQENKRKKPFRFLAARTIGYERDGVQPVGLEGAYSQYLSGVEGKRLMQKMAGGVYKPINDANEVEPEDGADIHTTIDINIQDVAENALLEQLTKHDADHGCVVVMEVPTGEIKAIANLNRDDDGDYAERYNYAIGESTEPGSVFKLMSLMAALEDGHVRLTDTIDCGNGRWKIYDRTLTDSHRGGFGRIALKDVFAFSSNIGTAKCVLEGYGKVPQSYIDRIARMGVSRPLGLELAGEGRPYFKSNLKDWSGITLPWSSIGYEVQMTPLQVLTFYNAVANNGRMVRPMFVKEIRSRGQVVKSFEPMVMNEAIASKKTIADAREMCEAVVEYGTARTSFKNSFYKVAGKTGTARIANNKYGYQYESEYSYQASFVGYFPAENPRYSCIVVVNAPSSGVYYGNAVAGPIFKEVADKIYALSIEFHEELEHRDHTAYSAIPYSKSGSSDDLHAVFAELAVETQTDPSVGEWAITQTSTENVSIQNRKIVAEQVPNVVGMGASDALYLLENMGLRVKMQGAGTIKEQSLPSGSKVQPGLEIVLQLS